MLRFAILGFLNYRPSTGYEVKQWMDRSTQHFWHARQSQIYMELKRMEEEELVASKEGQSGANRAIRTYKITKAGRQALMGWLQEPLEGFGKIKNPMLLRLFFSAGLGKEELLRRMRQLMATALKQKRAYSQEAKKTIQGIKEASPELAKDALLWETTRSFGQRYAEMYVKWLQESIEALEGKL